MRICVCVKQVPDTTEIRIDPEKNTLIRDGVPSIVNPFDGYALEAAARIKDGDTNSEITVISMGPQQAKSALKECLAIGADKAYLVTDRLFGGSDTYATSYILKNAIEYVEKKDGKFDVIFCGKQAIDGDTAQVGPEIAELLDYPQITYGLEVTEVDNTKIRVLKEGNDYNTVLEMDLPGLVTFTKPSFSPRYPSLKSKIQANRKEIMEITINELTDIDQERIGLKGSPTRVKRTFVPVRNKDTVFIKEETAELAAAALFKSLNENNII